MGAACWGPPAVHPDPKQFHSKLCMWVSSLLLGLTVVQILLVLLLGLVLHVLILLHVLRNVNETDQKS